MTDIATAFGLIESYHARTGTSIAFGAYKSDGKTIFNVAVATNKFKQIQFQDEVSLITFLDLLEKDVSADNAVLKMQRAEQLAIDQIAHDAEVATLQREIDELPQTQAIQNAMAAAAAKIAASTERLAELEKQRLSMEAEAERILSEVAQAEAQVNET